MSGPRTGAGVGRRLKGGAWGPLLFISFSALAIAFFSARYDYPASVRNYGDDVNYHLAMFGDKIEQPIPFSHRVHVTDKQIDCYYCHPYPERAPHAGMPSVDKCLSCHDYIIPEHEEIVKLRGFADRKEMLPWVRVYYNPDHSRFPHYRHVAAQIACQTCHGEVERADRLNQFTFYMGMCIDCHSELGASRECVDCHH